MENLFWTSFNGSPGLWKRFSYGLGKERKQRSNAKSRKLHRLHFFLRCLYNCCSFEISVHSAGLYTKFL